VIVSSAGFSCQGSYPAGKQYQLALGLVGRGAPMELGSYQVSTSGAFKATVVIPVTASPGEAYINVKGSPFDQCSDSSQDSCAGYGVGLVILPPSG
jgi:hypothetical protein